MRIVKVRIAAVAGFVAMMVALVAAPVTAER
jgi:hypothetical protein